MSAPLSAASAKRVRSAWRRVSGRRLEITITPAADEALDVVTEALEVASDAEALRLSVRLVALLLGYRTSGARVIVRHASGEEAELLLPAEEVRP